MGLNVASRYTFNGPFNELRHLLNQSGVYVITVIENGIHKVLDIGESANIRDRIKNHDRQDQWLHHAAGRPVHCSAFYCDEPNRMAMEAELRQFFAPPCGIR